MKWKALPIPGDRVEILEGRNVIYDFHEGVESPPPLKTLWINGNLIVPLHKVKKNNNSVINMGNVDYDDPKGIYDYLESSNKHDDKEPTNTRLEAEHIYIRKGRLFVGLHKDAGFPGVTDSN